ncbi:MAG: hypothetical protein AAI946_00220 [Candidatus Hodgkinia cicadicola]
MLIIADTAAGKSHTLNAIKCASHLPAAELNVKLMNLKKAKQEIEELVKSLYINSKFNKDKAERGIILIDNLEVLANSKAQLELIKLIRGASYRIAGFEDNELIASINTKDMLFICTISADALEGAEREGSKIGYELPNAALTNAKKLLPENESLVVNYKTKATEIGIVSELVNLFATVVVLKNDSKTISQLIPALTTEILLEYTKTRELNAKVIIDNNALAHITAAAHAIKLGVWGLKVVIHSMLQTAISYMANIKLLDVIVIGYNSKSRAYTVMSSLSATR